MVNRDNVKIFSFISGQEIVGEAKLEDGGWKVTQPMAIIMRPGPNGQGNLGLMPWPMLADANAIKTDGVHVHGEALACGPYKPNEQILSHYMAHVTGLAMPSTSPLILTESV